MTILLCAELGENGLSDQTAKAVTAAKKLGSDIHLLIAGKDISNITSSFEGVTKHIIADNDAFIAGNAENISDLILSIADAYDTIIAPATTTWKNILPRVSALLDTMMLSDVIEIIDGETFKRPIYAGNAIATVKNTQSKKIMTVRPTAFAASGAIDAPASDKNDFSALGDYASSFVSEELSKQDRPQLTSAKIVISGGRGMGSGENFKLIEDVADMVGAAIGASRAAVDAGFVPNDYQVGQTGKVVAPELYVAVGISGAIQHLAGMKDSKIIVAINKDEEAPIFSVADYGLVTDLFDALPALQEELTKLGYSAS